MSEARLKFSSILFAFLWTAGMLAWNFYSGAMSGPIGVITLVIAGVLAGFCWFWLMRMFFRWTSRHS